MAQQPQVVVEGMRALAKDLAKLTSDQGALNKALAQAARTALEPIAAQARSSMLSDTTPAKRPPHLVDTIRVTGTKTGGAVRMGRANVRWGGWVEFGGTRKKPVVSQRPYLSQGRYLWPAAKSLAPKAAELYAHAVTEAINNFPWTNEGDSAHD